MKHRNELTSFVIKHYSDQLHPDTTYVYATLNRSRYGRMYHYLTELVCYDARGNVIERIEFDTSTSNNDFPKDSNSCIIEGNVTL